MPITEKTEHLIEAIFAEQESRRDFAATQILLGLSTVVNMDDPLKEEFLKEFDSRMKIIQKLAFVFTIESADEAISRLLDWITTFVSELHFTVEPDDTSLGERTKHYRTLIHAALVAFPDVKRSGPTQK